ncbi:MAG: LOG family protein [Phycisphaerales bacterium]
MNEKIITIFGTSKAKEGDEIFQLAYEFGMLCGQSGFTIANGGYKGTMMAAAKGAKLAGGKTIGVTCTAFGTKGPNEFITQNIITENLTQRVAKLVEIADAYVVLPGGTGTLLELAEIWESTNKGFVNPAKPIILIGNFWKPLVELMAKDDAGCRDCIVQVDNAVQAVGKLKEYFSK